MSAVLQNHARSHAVRPRPGATGLPSDPLFRELLASPSLRRLRHVGFLGAPDYSETFRSDSLPYWRSRLAHSVGVAWVAGALARESGADPVESRLMIAAALLHDVGHPPLSHSAETAFIRRFGLDHNTATEKTIRGENRLGRDMPGILQRHDVRPSAIMDVLAGRGESRISVDAFRSPINVDTVDGIVRTARYFALPRRSRSELVQALATLGRGQYRTLDNFWLLKEQVYADHLSGPACTLLDQACADYLLAADLDEEQAYWTDDALLAAHPDLQRYLACVDLRTGCEDLPVSTKNTRPKKRCWIQPEKRPRALATLSIRYVRARKDPA